LFQKNFFVGDTGDLFSSCDELSRFGCLLTDDDDDDDDELECDEILYDVIAILRIAN
jgi:hypothetical protein